MRYEVELIPSGSGYHDGLIKGIDYYPEGMHIQIGTFPQFMKRSKPWYSGFNKGVKDFSTFEEAFEWVIKQILESYFSEPFHDGDEFHCKVSLHLYEALIVGKEVIVVKVT